MNTLVLIGASTGGPGHLKKILSSIKKLKNTSFIIAQHMNQNVIESFVSQLSQECKLPIIYTQEKQKICSSHIYICSNSLEFSKTNNQLYLIKSDKQDIYTPSINILFNSAVQLMAQYKVISILLTGIGDDGAKSMSNLYNNGAYCISESQESAIVYGMPKQAFEKNNNIKVMHLNNIIKFLENV